MYNHLGYRPTQDSNLTNPNPKPPNLNRNCRT